MSENHSESTHYANLYPNWIPEINHLETETLVMSEIAKTPTPPYCAVIFTSHRTEGNNGYGEMAARMVELAAQQPGFLGAESARESVGITVSYWADLESIKVWKDNAEHIIAQEKGQKIWYKEYKTRIAKIERDYGWGQEQG